MKKLAMLTFIAVYLLSVNIFAETNNISEVVFNEYKGKAVIKVVGTQKPTFTVFKLREPLRLIVDISNASIKGIESPIAINNNVIKQLITSQFEDDVNRTSRIMLSLKKDTKYSVKTVGNNFVLTLSNDSINGSKRVVAKNQNFKSELQKRDEELLRKEKALAIAKNKLAQKERLLESRKAQLKEKERLLQSKKTQLKLKEEKVASLNKKLTLIETREEQNSNSLTQLKKRNSSTIKLLNNLKSEKSEIEQENRRLAAQLNNLKKASKNNSSANKEKYSSLNNKISTLKSKKIALDKRLSSLNSDKSKISKELSTLTAEKNSLIKEKRVYNQKISSLSNENRALRSKLSVLEKQNSSINRNIEENKALKAKIARLENRKPIIINNVNDKNAELNDLKILKYKEKIVFKIDMKNYNGDFEIFELNKPNRIVLELPNTQLNGALNKNKSFNNDFLKSVRLGENGSKSSLIVDISKKSEMPKYFLKKEKDTLVLTLLTNKKVKFQNLLGVKSYSNTDDSNVVLKFDKKVKYSLVREDDDLAVVKFYNVKTPEQLQDTINLAKGTSELKMASVFQSGDDTILAIKLNKKVENKISFDNNTFVWKFKNREKVVKNNNNNIVKYTKAEAAAYTKTANISKKRYKGKRISIDFKNADIHDVLELIADVSKVNIITSDEVSGTVTIRLRNVQWDKALDVILKTKGLGKEQLGNILRIAPMETLEKEFQKEIDKMAKLKGNKPLSVRLIPVSYARVEELVDQVKGILSKRGTVTVDVRTNMLIVKDISEKLSDAEELIKNLDTQTPQVLIEGRIVEASSAFSSQQGVQWGGAADANANKGTSTGLYFPSSGKLNGYTSDGQNGTWITNLPSGEQMGGLNFAVGSISDSLGLRLRLTAAESDGNLKIVSSPRISTLDNKEATIETGVKIPVITLNAQGVPTSKMIDAKIKLTVTPHVTSDGSIILKIDLTKEEPDFGRTNSLGDPAIISKKATTELLIKDGETAVIGGMYTKKVSSSTKSVPFFGKLPVIGWFFRSTARTDERAELLIFITPRIINRNNSISR